MMAREADSVSTKEENNGTNEKGSNPQSSSGLSSWARSRDPRIVRVSRAFGGKDRHSKVCTVRGLRDRRVRLSVPTAIQLYDLQDRLGLNQPSKVVDWLLDAAKNEIDELPPLQMPPGNLINHNLESLLASHQSNKHVAPNGSNSWISDALLRNNTKSKDQETWTRRSDDQDNDQCAYVTPNDMMSNVHSHSPTSGQQFMRWDSSTLSLAQSGSSGNNMTQQQEDNHGGFNVLPLGPSGAHHVLLYQPSMNQSYCPSNTSAEDFVPKQFNFHMLNSSSTSESQLSNQLGTHFDLSTSARPPSDQK